MNILKPFHPIRQHYRAGPDACVSEKYYLQQVQSQPTLNPSLPTNTLPALQVGRSGNGFRFRDGTAFGISLLFPRHCCCCCCCFLCPISATKGIRCNFCTISSYHHFHATGSQRLTRGGAEFLARRACGPGEGAGFSSAGKMST